MNFTVTVVVVLNRTCLMTLKLDCLKLLGVESCNILKLPVFLFLQGGNFMFRFHKTEVHQKCPPLQKDGTLV